VDSHLALPLIRKTKEQLLATELVPFHTLVQDGIASIMTGHMALPLVTGCEKPSSLDATITENLLRQEMAFKGVVITDCLEMEAVAKLYGSENGAVMALKAGADVAMLCHEFERQKGAVQNVLMAVERGDLSIDRLVQSGRRIQELKNKFCGTWQDVLTENWDQGDWVRLKSANSELSRRAYGASTAVIDDGKGILPLRKEIACVVFTPQVNLFLRLSVEIFNNEILGGELEPSH
jgi:beta-glucosidase-like glycosyl hydrolase